MFADRLDRVRALMAERSVDVLLLSVGADLPYFCGYEAMPLERLTMLVVPRDAGATLVVARLEAPRVTERKNVFGLRAWDEAEDPVAIVAQLAGPAATVAVGDQMWSRFLVELMGAMPSVSWRRASEVTAEIRSVKDASRDRAAAGRGRGRGPDRRAAPAGRDRVGGAHRG